MIGVFFEKDWHSVYLLFVGNDVSSFGLGIGVVIGNTGSICGVEKYLGDISFLSSSTSFPKTMILIFN